MAGKTFPGMGELEEEPVDPADAADSGATSGPSGPFYSGPTVVDDVKVEEGLQKLRTLGTPAHAPVKDGGRGTYIGHSVADGVPPPEPEKPYDDRMRGTLFGHMLHLPELKLPELKLPAPEEPSSRELTIVDQSAPTSHALEVYQPDVARAASRDLARRAAAGIPLEAQAFPRSDRYRSVPVEIEPAPQNKVRLRVGIAAAAIAAIVGAVVIWLHNSTEEPELQARPAAVAPQAAPVAAPAPPPPPPAAATPPAPAAAVDSPAEPAQVEPPREATRPKSDHAHSVASRPAPPPPPAGVARPEHHHSSVPPATDAPPKTRAGKRPSLEDDPDGTLAPSID